MQTKQKQAALRSQLFRHLDGIVSCPVADLFRKREVTDYLLLKKTISLKELASHFKANEGYLNVALRTLCSQGWLSQEVDNDNDTVTFHTNEKSEIAFNHFGMYRNAAELMRMSQDYHPRMFEIEPFLMLEDTFEDFKNNTGIVLAEDGLSSGIQQQILSHIEGIIVGPTLVHLGMSGMFHKYFMETKFRAEEFHRNPEGFERLLDILTDLDWFSKTNGSFEFTSKGLFYAKRASAYGVTVSYIPTLRNLDNLIFGNPLKLKTQAIGETEKHVDREMNVWGSGGAHSSYFKVVDDIIIDIFNRPIRQQPKGILDMGCGNGAFLKHLFNVIETRTRRGEMLDDYPLMLIGVDYNEAALDVSRQNLIQADIWAKIMWGDIGNPQKLADDLLERYDLDLADLLNVRTFLDHNRVWEMPTEKHAVTNSTGSYAYRGNRINNKLVKASLIEHFKKWTPYVQKFGLLLIELHTLDPKLAAQNLGKTAATAYDATHGYSDQYIVEIDEFLDALEKAGLKHDPNRFRKFPNSELATVSVNLFKS